MNEQIKAFTVVIRFQICIFDILNTATDITAQNFWML